MKKVVLISGSSSGIGKSCIHAFLKKGYIVYASSRTLHATFEQSTNLHRIQLDVTDATSIKTCVQTILKEQGRIDILVNNAGYGYFGAIEDVSMIEAKKQMEVNVFGLVALTKEVLPYMRQQKNGKIINVSSMGGRVSTPFGGWYHSTKYAVEGLSNCLRLEVQPFGIHVVLIEPGAIKTNWGNIASQHLIDSSQTSDYKKQSLQAAKQMRKMYSKNITAPEVIAKCIVKASECKHPKPRYLLGYNAKAAVYFHKIFGDRVYDFMIKQVYKL